MNPLANPADKATIADVARLAGVSIKTVSRVANGLPNVSKATRAKVQRAIDDLDYTANPYAKHLGSIRHPDHLPARTQLPPSSQAESSKTEQRDIDWW